MSIGEPMHVNPQPALGLIRLLVGEVKVVGTVPALSLIHI
jgi:hypothetical protein